MTTEIVKTRFAPSPTGHLHIGSARTALFNYLLAKKTGGTFLLRIEDTDRARHVEGAAEQVVADLQWLGIVADEGAGVGGDDGPYVQSERLEIYRDYTQRLIQAGKAYYALDTAEQLDAARAAAEAKGEHFRYQRPETLPTAAEAQQARDEGRPVVVRLMAGAAEVTVVDEVFGEVTVPADQQDDFIIQKADGYPTYHLANVVDDSLMGVTHIVRGQEFLGQSWRHKLLRQALGMPEPTYAHLPLIMDLAGRKLSKRDGDVDVFSFRQAGYLPEAIVSFVAQLGWSPPEGRERLGMDELIECFSIDRLGKSNAKFDREKLLAFNTDAAAEASEDRLLEAFADYCALNATPFPADQPETLRTLLRVNAGFRTFADIVTKSGVLFVADEQIEHDPKAVKKVLEKNDGEGWAMLKILRAELAACEWTESALEALVVGLCEREGVGMGKVAQPIRVAVTGSTISPAIYDTLLLLGKETTLNRIDRTLTLKM